MIAFTVQMKTSNDATGLEHQQNPDVATKRRHGPQESLSKTLERRIEVSKED